MAIFFFALLVITLIGMKPAKGGFHDDYMSMWKTNCVKGFFVVLIFFRHFPDYFKFNNIYDVKFMNVFGIVGQLIVTVFLFVSGFGILEAIKKKGDGYINKLPKNRILKTWLNFAIAVALFLIVDTLLSIKYPVSTSLLAFTGWTDIGNSNWYIFSVLVLYILTFIAFKISKGKALSGTIIVTVLTVAYIILMYFVKNRTSTYFYNTVLCYCAGMWFSLYKDKFDNFITKNNIIYFSCLALSLVACAGAFVVYHFAVYTSTLLAVFCYEIHSIFFCLFIFILTMKVAIGNKVLYWLGSHVFSIYILQRLPMLILSKLGFVEWLGNTGLEDFSVYIFFALSLIITLLIAPLFDLLTGKLNKVLFKK